MTHLTGPERAQYVQGMFARIAGHYDLMNRLMTFGQDRRWRQEVIRRAALPPEGSLLLDLGGGTGDLGFEALRQNPATRPIEADFTFEMLRVGMERWEQGTGNRESGKQGTGNRRTGTQETGSPSWAVADALTLPFPDGTFDAVVSGFLMRNVIDVPGALREQLRVLKPGGRIVILDTTRPRKNLFTPLVRLHMHVVIPLLGRLIAGQGDAYEYLPESSENFLTAETLAAHMIAAGFQQVVFRRLNFGTIAIHWGERGAEG